MRYLSPIINLNRLKFVLSAVTASSLLGTTAFAQSGCTSYPNNLMNGFTADATKVMGNFACAALTSGATINNATLTGATTLPGSGTITSSGNVGIGFYPNNALSVAGVIQFGAYSVYPVLPGSQGGYLAWNITGIGETDFINQKGGGSGGFYFYNATGSGTLGSAIATIDPSGTYTPSDARNKTRIINLGLDESLSKITKLRPVSYILRQSPKSGAQYGFLAQEVDRVFPSLVMNTHSKSNLTPDGERVLNYTGLIAPTIEAVKALDARTNSLIAINKAQESEIRQLRAELENIARRVNDQRARIDGRANRKVALQ